ncbi:hypothetical protein [Vreelandella massiliensis]|uniref:hypothetical protein n=1 Tax=Vreelandella massiliensis TaxID=1816686 RepID=UPI00096A2E6F|nr:hypothetical protein [Halomonas massiliensis]
MKNKINETYFSPNPLDSELPPPWVSISQFIFNEWLKSSWRRTQPLINIQLDWYKNAQKMFQIEMQLCQAIIDIHEKNIRIIITYPMPEISGETQRNFQQAMQDTQQLNLMRIQKALEMNHAFHRAIWEEI